VSRGPALVAARWRKGGRGGGRDGGGGGFASRVARERVTEVKPTVEMIKMTTFRSVVTMLLYVTLYKIAAWSNIKDIYFCDRSIFRNR
jgi:hypothetical protein